MGRRVVLDTDIGTDVDDALALALALASPELELVAVTTVSGDTTLRARIAARLLALAGRTDVPVHAGCAEPLGGTAGFAWFGHEGDGILDRSRDAVAPEPAVDALLRLFREQDGLELVTIGPLTNVAVALERDPGLAGRIARLTAMGGWLRGVRHRRQPAAAGGRLQPVLRSGRVPARAVGRHPDATRPRRRDGPRLADRRRRRGARALRVGPARRARPRRARLVAAAARSLRGPRRAAAGGKCRVPPRPAGAGVRARRVVLHDRGAGHRAGDDRRGVPLCECARRALRVRFACAARRRWTRHASPTTSAGASASPAQRSPESPASRARKSAGSRCGLPSSSTRACSVSPSTTTSPPRAIS